MIGDVLRWSFKCSSTGLSLKIVAFVISNILEGTSIFSRLAVTKSYAR